MKQCCRCSTEKPLSEFYTDRAKLDGKTSRCKTCCKIVATERYFNNHKDGLEYRRRYREAHREQMAEYKREWNDNNRERYRSSKRKNELSRRARKLDRFIELVDPMVLFERDNGICGICASQIKDDFHVDHIVPLSRGGSHSYDNTQIAHPRCNLSKGSRTVS
jgi:5-methylcytosine-specific restriction endonuclease McrA